MPASSPPVLLIHGIWNTGAAFDDMATAISQGGQRLVAAPSLSPNDGRAALELLAEQVDVAARALLQRSLAERLDLVGFSMGALVSRYWLQRLGGKQLTRRFVSIAGPHAGTVVAWGSPYAGVQQMRPRSKFLSDLAADTEPFAGVEVHTIGTPYDLMIVPAQSTSSLAHARTHTWIHTALHRSLLTDARAIAKVVALLDAP